MIRFCLFLLLVAYSHASLADSLKTITLATGEFPPHISADLPEKGGFSEIVVKAFEKSGYTVNLEFYPWKRAYHAAKELHADATYSWTPKPERKKDFAFSDPIFILERRVFVMKESSIYAQTAEELTGLRLCRPLGYTLHATLEEMYHNREITLVRPPDMVTCFRFMQEGRVDFIELAYEEGITSALSALGTLDLVRTLDFTPGTNPNALAVSLRHPNKETLLHDFNRGLTQLRQSGEYDEIVKRHHMHFLDSLTRKNS